MQHKSVSANYNDENYNLFRYLAFLYCTKPYLMVLQKLDKKFRATFK